MVCLWAAPVQGRDVQTLESTYLGEGMFRYRIHTFDDPFFNYLYVFSFGIHGVTATNLGVNPPHWSSNLQPTAVLWDFVGQPAGNQVRPYTATFTMQSSLTNFRRKDLGAFVTMELSTVGAYHGHTEAFSGGGYWNADVLVPCAPEDADGSSTNLLAVGPFGGPADIRIVELLRQGDSVMGVKYDYAETNTVRLEASRDMLSWTNVAYIYGGRPTTSWTNSTPLNAYGNYFRLRLVAEGHAPSVPPLSAAAGFNAASSGASDSSGRILSCVPSRNSVTVRFQAVPGRRYKVSSMDGAFNVREQREVIAASDTESVSLPVADGTVACLVQVSEIK